MFGIFMESLVIFKLYTGLKLLFLMTAMALIYLMIKEKNPRNRILFVYAPILIVLIFLFPVTRKAFVAMGLDGETYYRILWTLPMGMITTYGGISFFGKHHRIGLAVLGGFIALMGSLVYKSDYITKAENAYHIPDAVIEVCEMVDNHIPNWDVRILVPSDMVHYVRQYNSEIDLTYGRDYLVPRWGYYNAVHEAYEVPETIDMDELLEATREDSVQYIVFRKDRQLNKSPLDAGLILKGELEDYLVYEDPVVTEEMKGWMTEDGL